MYDDNSQREESRLTEMKLLNRERLIYCNSQSTDLTTDLAIGQKINGLCVYACIRRVIYGKQFFRWILQTKRFEKKFNVTQRLTTKKYTITIKRKQEKKQQEHNSGFSRTRIKKHGLLLKICVMFILSDDTSLNRCSNNLYRNFFFYIKTYTWNWNFDWFDIKARKREKSYSNKKISQRRFFLHNRSWKQFFSILFFYSKVLDFYFRRIPIKSAHTRIKTNSRGYDWKSYEWSWITIVWKWLCFFF